MALLAQTCSQIGADSSAVKPLLSVDKNKKTETSKSPSTISKTPKSNTTPTENRSLAFRPYETNVYTKVEDRPSSKSSCANESVSDDRMRNGNARVPSRNKTNSPESAVLRLDIKSETGKYTPNGSDRKSASPDRASQRGASPIIRPGMEVLHGSPKDMAALSAYKSNAAAAAAFGLSPLAALCCPPGMEQHANPAFRPPFGGGFSHHHAALLAAAAAGYPGSGASSAAASTNNPGPYVSYARVKTPSGGETIVPVCKDPYCTGCPYSQHHQQMMMGAPCPAGCTQCEHQKYGLAMAMSALPPGHPYAQLGRPLVCNWIAGDSYCGKRFTNPDELMQHLRTHTANLSDPTAAAAALAQSQQAMMHPLSSLFAASALHRGYPTPPLSPMSAARYHPYAKPGASMPSTLPGSPYATFNPASLNPYYSPYAMYGQRFGAAAAAAAVHQ